MSASVEVYCVPPDRNGAMWPYVEAMLTAAVKRTNLNHSSDIEASLSSGTALLWVAWREEKLLGAMTTELVMTDTSKICVMSAIGGSDMDAWLPMLPRLEGYAIDEGCDLIRAVGRKGWQRVLKDYTVSNIVLEKRL